LELVLREAGFDVKYASYYNTILFPLAVVQRVMQRLKKSNPAQVGTAMPPRLVNAIFRGIFASERHVLGRLPLPFG